eukprot:COSAG01_NODE_1585_length_9810_cov_8.980435_15_plen_38_part_00
MEAPGQDDADVWRAVSTSPALEVRAVIAACLERIGGG